MQRKSICFIERKSIWATGLSALDLLNENRPSSVCIIRHFAVQSLWTFLFQLCSRNIHKGVMYEKKHPSSVLPLQRNDVLIIGNDPNQYKTFV